MESATQLLSKHVHTKVTLVKTHDDDYVRMALQFPMLVRRNGLLQALRYAKFQGEKKQDETSGYGLFFKHFCDLQLSGEPVLMLASFIPRGADPILAIEALSLEPDYLRATQIALIQAEWFKRFAQSVLEAKPKAASYTESTNVS